MSVLTHRLALASALVFTLSACGSKTKATAEGPKTASTETQTKKTALVPRSAEENRAESQPTMLPPADDLTSVRREAPMVDESRRSEVVTPIETDRDYPSRVNRDAPSRTNTRSKSKILSGPVYDLSTEEPKKRTGTSAETSASGPASATASASASASVTVDYAQPGSPRSSSPSTASPSGGDGILVGSSVVGTRRDTQTFCVGGVVADRINPNLLRYEGTPFVGGSNVTQSEVKEFGLPFGAVPMIQVGQAVGTKNNEARGVKDRQVAFKVKLKLPALRDIARPNDIRAWIGLNFNKVVRDDDNDHSANTEILCLLGSISSGGVIREQFCSGTPYRAQDWVRFNNEDFLTRNGDGSFKAANEHFSELVLQDSNNRSLPEGLRAEPRNTVQYFSLSELFRPENSGAKGLDRDLYKVLYGFKGDPTEAEKNQPREVTLYFVVADDMYVGSANILIDFQQNFCEKPVRAPVMLKPEQQESRVTVPTAAAPAAPRVLRKRQRPARNDISSKISGSSTGTTPRIKSEKSRTQTPAGPVKVATPAKKATRASKPKITAAEVKATKDLLKYVDESKKKQSKQNENTPAAQTTTADSNKVVRVKDK